LSFVEVQHILFKNAHKKIKLFIISLESVLPTLCSGLKMLIYILQNPLDNCGKP